MVIKRMLESNVLVAGGGAVETALSIYLESFATTLGSREQLAIAEFAEALLVIPKTLAVNAAQVQYRVVDAGSSQRCVLFQGVSVSAVSVPFCCFNCSMIVVTEYDLVFCIFRLMKRRYHPPFLCHCLASVQDATELVAKLRAYHNTSQLQEDKVGERQITTWPIYLLCRPDAGSQFQRL